MFFWKYIKLHQLRPLYLSADESILWIVNSFDVNNLWISGYIHDEKWLFNTFEATLISVNPTIRHIDCLRKYFETVIYWHKKQWSVANFITIPKCLWIDTSKRELARCKTVNLWLYSRNTSSTDIRFWNTTSYLQIVATWKSKQTLRRSTPPYWTICHSYVCAW